MKDAQAVIARTVEDAAREIARRREMLVAGLMVEAGLGPARVELVARPAGPGAVLWAARLRPGRWSGWRGIWRALRFRLAPAARRRAAALARELHDLGLTATDVGLLQRFDPPSCGFVKESSLQVVCRRCGKRVAATDFVAHVENKHGGPKT